MTARVPTRPIAPSGGDQTGGVASPLPAEFPPLLDDFNRPDERPPAGWLVNGAVLVGPGIVDEELHGADGSGSIVYEDLYLTPPWAFTFDVAAAPVESWGYFSPMVDPVPGGLEPFIVGVTPGYGDGWVEDPDSAVWDAYGFLEASPDVGRGIDLGGTIGFDYDGAAMRGCYRPPDGDWEVVWTRESDALTDPARFSVNLQNLRLDNFRAGSGVLS